MEETKQITIELGGKTYPLAFDINVMIDMKRHGVDLKGIMSVFKKTRSLEGRFEMTRKLIAVAIYCQEPQTVPFNEKFEREIGKHMKLSEVSTYMQKVLEACGHNLEEFEGQLAPYVDSPMKVVDRMLEMADTGPGDLVADLGAGDGRVLKAAMKLGAKSIGVERHEGRYKKLIEAGLDVVKTDIMEFDLLGASVVFIYLLEGSNEKLKGKLLTELAPGARVVSHDFHGMGDWEPEVTDSVDVAGETHELFMWRVPERGSTPVDATA